MELEDSINITYGILDNIFQILDTEHVPVMETIHVWQFYRKKVAVILLKLSKKTP